VPKIQWTHLPPEIRDHLFDRLRERKITAEDLYQLKVWRESDPEARRSVVQGFRLVQSLWRRKIPEDVSLARPDRPRKEAL